MESLKIIFALAFIFLFTHLVIAERIDSDLSLTVQCTNSTYANLTYAKYVSTSVYLINTEQAMTKNGIFYNYSIPAINNTQAGTIEYGYRCDVDGIDYSSGNQIYVSMIGEDLSSSTGILYIVLVVGLVIIFLITVYGAMVFPWRNNRNEDGEIISINDLKYLKIVLWILAYLEMLFIVSILKNLSGYLLNEGTYAFFNMVFMLMLIALLPFFPALVFFTIVIWLSDKKTQKAIAKGIPVQ